MVRHIILFDFKEDAPEEQIIAAVHAMGALTRLHICGNTAHILPDMIKSGADIIDLDWMVNMRAAAERFGKDVAFCGNVDPVAVMLQGVPEQVHAATRACAKVGGPLWICGAGCEIPDGTPSENFQAQSRALEDFGSDPIQ